MSLNKIEKPPAQVVAQTKVLAGKIKHSKLQSFSKKDSVLASKDYHQNQVPRKKIKVSAASTSTVNNQPPSAVVKSADFAKADCLASTSTLAHASPFAESQTFTSFYVDVGMYGDDSMPGCSTSSKQDSFSYQKSPSPSSSDSCSSSVPASTSQMKITSFLPVKKHAKPKKMKFGKATSMGAKKSAKKLLKPIGNLTNSVNNLNSLNTISVNNVSTPAPDELELSVDETTVSTSIASVSLVGNSSRSSKLLKKKKRTLKTEVKRKKIRGKPLLH